MSRSFRFAGLLSLALIFFVSETNSALAQTRRSPFSTSRVSLATLPPVQKELGLTEDQKQRANELHDQFVEDRREVFQNGGGDWDSMREDIEKLDAEATAVFIEKLDDRQKRRLTEILVQANGPNALADPAVIEIVDLTTDQQSKLDEIRQANREDMFDAFQDFQSMSDEERRETMEKLQEDGDSRILAVLTDEQREVFNKLPGEEVDYDLAQIRGAFPGGGGGGRNSRPVNDGNRPQRPE